MGLDNLGEATAFATIRNSFQTGAQLQENSNPQYNHSDILGVYTYLTNYGHKNVFIVTKNNEDMDHILSKLHSNPITILFYIHTIHNVLTQGIHIELLVNLVLNSIFPWSL